MLTAEQLAAASDEALDRARLAINAEQERRATLATAAAEIQAITERYKAALGRKPGDPWQQPAGAHDSVPVGAVVEHRGRYWRNAHGTVNP